MKTLIRLREQALRNPKELARFAKFATVGAFGAVVDFGILNLLILMFGWPKWAANTVSFSCAVLSNFTWNRLWTFPESREFPLSSQMTQFAVVNVVGLAINQVVFLGLAEVFAPHIATPWDYNLAKALAIAVVLFWNFGVNRVWTYGEIE